MLVVSPLISNICNGVDCISTSVYLNCNLSAAASSNVGNNSAFSQSTHYLSADPLSFWGIFTNQFQFIKKRCCFLLYSRWCSSTYSFISIKDKIATSTCFLFQNIWMNFKQYFNFLVIIKKILCISRAQIW